MQRQFDIFVGEAPDVLAVHWGWVIALGIGLVVLGFFAIWRARAATLISVGFLGVLLLVSAVSVLIFAFSLAGYWTDFFAACAVGRSARDHRIDPGDAAGDQRRSDNADDRVLFHRARRFGDRLRAIVAHRGRMALRVRRCRERGPWMSSSRGLAPYGPLGHWAFHRNRFDPQRQFDRRPRIGPARDLGVKPDGGPR